MGQCVWSVDFALICFYLNVFSGSRGDGETGGGRLQCWNE